MNHMPAWLLVFFRLGGIFIIAPVFGSSTIPRQVKILLALVLSLCVYPMLLNVSRPSYALIQPVLDQGLELWSLVPMIGLEVLIGFVVGYCASLPLIGAQMGGNVIAQQLGLGFASVVNPEIDGQSGVVDQFYFLLALAMFLILGGHRTILTILVGSFDAVPLGGFSDFEGLLAMALGLVQLTFEMALRIAAPLLCLIFLISAAMGFIARTVPQMNILSVGFSIRILVGVSIVTAFLVSAANVYESTLNKLLKQLLLFFAM